MKVSLFDFDLPEDRIALRPVVPRDSARMLVVEGDRLRDVSVRDLPDELAIGDVLLLNETKVFNAALKGTRPARAHGGGGDASVEVNLHKAVGDGEWMAFARPAKRLRIGDNLAFGALSAEVVDKDGGEIRLRFDRAGDALQADFAKEGYPPLPPYIASKRETDARDLSDYQTTYAKDEGSVAAPTAGLHFTPELLSALEAKGVEIATLTLHVGAGTFLPVKTDDTDDHAMHSEWFTLSRETADRLNRAKTEGRRIVCVGTTSLRALESAAVRYPDGSARVEAQTRDTDIFITPGYDFAMADGLMTNFHLPRSTLFMLVSAFAGLQTMQDAYAHAIEEGYRFYSYGDSSLLWRKT